MEFRNFSLKKLKFNYFLRKSQFKYFNSLFLKKKERKDSFFEALISYTNPKKGIN